MQHIEGSADVFENRNNMTTTMLMSWMTTMSNNIEGLVQWMKSATTAQGSRTATTAHDHANFMDHNHRATILKDRRNGRRPQK
jgi:hypothetical protein